MIVNLVVEWDDPTLPEAVELELPHDVDDFDIDQVISDLLFDRYGEVPNRVTRRD